LIQGSSLHPGFYYSLQTVPQFEHLELIEFVSSSVWKTRDITTGMTWYLKVGDDAANDIKGLKIASIFKVNIVPYAVIMVNGEELDKKIPQRFLNCRYESFTGDREVLLTKDIRSLNGEDLGSFNRSGLVQMIVNAVLLGIIDLDSDHNYIAVDNAGERIYLPFDLGEPNFTVEKTGYQFISTKLLVSLVSELDPQEINLAIGDVESIDIGDFEQRLIWFKFDACQIPDLVRGFAAKKGVLRPYFFRSLMKALVRSDFFLKEDLLIRRDLTDYVCEFILKESGNEAIWDQYDFDLFGEYKHNVVLFRDIVAAEPEQVYAYAANNNPYLRNDLLRYKKRVQTLLSFLSGFFDIYLVFAGSKGLSDDYCTAVKQRLQREIYNGQQRLIMLDRQIAVMKNFRRKDSPLYLKLQAIKDAILPKTMPVDSAV